MAFFNGGDPNDPYDTWDDPPSSSSEASCSRDAPIGLLGSQHSTQWAQEIPTSAEEIRQFRSPSGRNGTLVVDDTLCFFALDLFVFFWGGE